MVEASVPLHCTCSDKEEEMSCGNTDSLPCSILRATRCNELTCHFPMTRQIPMGQDKKERYHGVGR
jgi:hypothetical protein